MIDEISLTSATADPWNRRAPKEGRLRHLPKFPGVGIQAESSRATPVPGRILNGRIDFLTVVRWRDYCEQAALFEMLAALLRENE
jgi:hypothetical protein